MRLSISALLAVFLMFGSRGVRADEPTRWPATFESSALASYLPSGQIEVIVVAAGTPSPELRAAADALAAALRLTGRVGTVLDDASLGELGPIDDAAVLTKVRPLPVTHVAIVRLLVGEPPKALVSLYAKGGSDPVASFIATSGVALVPGAVESEGQAGSGVSRAAVDKVGNLQEESKAEDDAAKLRYRSEFVGYDGIDVTITSGNGWAAANVSTRFYQGELKQPLEGASFYKAVDRDDLAGDYETRSQARSLLMVGGVIVAVAGLIPMTQWESCDVGAAPGAFESCMSSNEDLIIWSVALMGVGGLGFTIGRFIDPDPVDDAARRNLAEEHNAGLKSGLHLDQARAGKPRRHAWNVAPSLGRSYQGVSFALTF